jgi:uncharacterized membrane protein YedE/YeeE
MDAADTSRLRPLFALLSGLLFGLGLAVSGMANPAKVLGFLDFAGAWDPTLALVMFGALMVTMPGFRLVLRRERPWYADAFSLPTSTDLEPRLLIGAAIFGLGWGLAGLCPGPAVADLVTGRLEILVFVAAMLAGMALFSRLHGAALRSREAPHRTSDG